MSEHVTTAMLGIVGIVCLLAFLARGGSCRCFNRCRQGNLVGKIAELQQVIDDLKRSRMADRKRVDSLEARLRLLEESGVDMRIYTELSELRAEIQRLKNRRHKRFALVIRRNITQVHDERGGFSWLFVLLFATIGLVTGALGSALWETSQVNVNGVAYTMGDFVNEPGFVIFWGVLGTLIGAALGFIPSRRSRRRS